MRLKWLHIQNFFNKKMKNFCKRRSEDNTILTEDQIQYLLNNTPFDREEINEWHREFLV